MSSFGGLYSYVKKVFVEEGEREDITSILKVFDEILASYRDAKEKYPIPRTTFVQ